MKSMQLLEVNMLKAFTLLWDLCAKGMQSKIKAQAYFVSEIKVNPIKLIKSIKNHALNYHEHQFEMSIILMQYIFYYVKSIRSLCRNTQNMF